MNSILPIVSRSHARRDDGSRRGLALVPPVVVLLLASSLAAAPLPELKSDPAPLGTDSQPVFSFKPVVRRVAPSVVNIYTNKNGAMP